VQASRPEIIGSDQATKNRSKSDIEGKKCAISIFMVSCPILR
jgi:hypothetical protein